MIILHRFQYKMLIFVFIQIKKNFLKMTGGDVLK